MRKSIKTTTLVKNLTYQLFEEMEDLKDEMVKTLTGNQASARRSRVKSSEFAKLLKEYRAVTLDWKDNGEKA